MSLCWLRGLVVVLRSWRTSALACSFVFESWSVWSVEILFLFAEGDQKTDRVLLDTLLIGGVIRLFSMWSVRLSARRLRFSGHFSFRFRLFGSHHSCSIGIVRLPGLIVPPAGHQCVQSLFVESPLATSCKFSIGIFLTFALLSENQP